MGERYGQKYAEKYGSTGFMPQALQDAVRQLDRTKHSILQGKVATPPDALQSVQEWDRTLRPHHLVAERSTRSQANIQENYKCVFAKFGDIDIQTGTEMTNTYSAW